MRAGARGTSASGRHIHRPASGTGGQPDNGAAPGANGRPLLNGEIVARALSDLAESGRRAQLELIAGE
jgi:hypothetical protein